MPQRRLKLKQASAVLKVEPKELQNLVQFGVVKPKWVDGAYLFDKETLLTAKVAFRLKESLGTRANVLSRLIEVFRASEKGLRAKNPAYVVFTCRFSREEEPIKLGVPFRSFGDEIEQGLSRADLYRDLPPGRKRAGWKKEFLEALSDAAKDIGEISEEEIQRTIRRLSRGEARSGDHRCSRNLGRRSNVLWWTRTLWWRVSPVFGTSTFQAEFGAPTCFTAGRKRNILFGFTRKTFSPSTRKS